MRRLAWSSYCFVLPFANCQLNAVSTVACSSYRDTCGIEQQEYASNTKFVLTICVNQGLHRYDL